MNGALAVCGALGLLVAGSPAAAPHGISAEIVPAEVRPGDLIELRVTMDRPDFARFELEVPTHERLHRVAVESVPVSVVGGRYRQSETWLLQADSSGEILIDGASVELESAGGTESVALPALRVEVLAYGQADESSDPVELPPAPPVTGAWWRNVAVLFGLSVLVIFGLFCLAGLCAIVWLVSRARRAGVGEQAGEGEAMHQVLAELDAGRIATPALERMMMERGDGWNPELREAVAAALYAGRGEAGEIAAMLRGEVGR